MFWSTFWDSMRQAYNKAFKNPIKTTIQEWRDINKINFLDIFVGKLNNLANTEATFEVESDSVQAEQLKTLCKDLESKRFTITESMLADGDYYIFPAHNENGDIIHTYLTQQQVRILDMDGEEIREAYGIIDWLIDDNNRVFYLLRHHKLDSNGTLTVSYSSITDQGKKKTVDEWKHLNEQAYKFINANHIGFGRYKSPVSDRGMSHVYGVPLNFGCGDIEAKIFNDLKLIEEEFKNAKSKIFADEFIIREANETDKGEKAKQYKIIENIFPIKQRAGQSGPNIDIFSPAIRYSEHYSKLVADMALYEKEVGTSKGILTDNQTTETATATAVKRANADTLALLNKIHTAIDNGNEMTLLADGVFMNISPELWAYKSDYFDPFEDPDSQWQRLLEAKGNGAAESIDLVKWLFPNLPEEQLDEKILRIKADSKADTNDALDKIFAGE